MKQSFDKFRDTLNRNYETLKLISSNSILLNGWFKYRGGKVVKRNFGDELNIYLLKHLLPNDSFTNLIDTCNWGSKSVTNYLVIGSLIEEFTTPMSEIWGAGAIEGGNHILRNKPRKVWAVRGKLSREYLLENNVECPAVYGDPALLLPLIYPCKRQPVHDVGIIPHVSEINHDCVKQLLRQGAKLIRLDEYDTWQSVIDQICSCRVIISSSLHGLIVSDAYSVPNVWCTFSDNLLGGHFKFYDYFSSVDRLTKAPIKINDSVTLSDPITIAANWKRITFDAQKLIDNAPWKLNVNLDRISEVEAYINHNNPGL